MGATEQKNQGQTDNRSRIIGRQWVVLLWQWYLMVKESCVPMQNRMFVASLYIGRRFCQVEMITAAMNTYRAFSG